MAEEWVIPEMNKPLEAYKDRLDEDEMLAIESEQDFLLQHKLVSQTMLSNCTRQDLESYAFQHGFRAGTANALKTGVPSAPIAATGLTNVQVLRHHPMPAMDYHPASHNCSSTEHLHHPEAVVLWNEVHSDQGTKDLDEAILLHTSLVKPAGNYAVPSALSATPYYGTEQGPFQCYIPAIIDPINQLLRYESTSSSNSSCCGISIPDYRWTPQCSSQIIDQQERTQWVPVETGGGLEFELVHLETKESRSVVGVKRSEVLASLSPDWNLPRAWNDEVYDIRRQSDLGGRRAVSVISQIYTNMCRRGQKYGAVTTYDGTWLFCCVENGTLLVSRRYGQQDNNPTAREALYYLTHQALWHDAVRNPWQGQQQPGKEDQGPSNSSSLGAGSYKRRGMVQLPTCLVASTTKPLGSGACGTAYMGWFETGGAPIPVAIKAALAPHVQKLLQNEADIYGCLQAVQGVIVPRLHYSGPGVENRGCILATELIHGQVLTDDNTSPQLLDVALQALRKVHFLGVVHGDLRGSNILVQGSRVWLIDFSHAAVGVDHTSLVREEQLMCDLFDPGWMD